MMERSRINYVDSAPELTVTKGTAIFNTWVESTTAEEQQYSYGYVVAY